MATAQELQADPRYTTDPAFKAEVDAMVAPPANAAALLNPTAPTQMPAMAAPVPGIDPSVSANAGGPINTANWGPANGQINAIPASQVGVTRNPPGGGDVASGGVPVDQPMIDPTTGMPRMGTTTESSDTSKSMGAAGTKAMEDAAKANADAVKLRSDADSAMLGVTVAKATAEKNLLEEQNKETAIRNQQQQDEVQKRLGEIEKARAKFDGMSIDNKRLFGHGPTPSKLMAIIGMSLGAAGGALAGRDFGVNQLVEKAIEQDIDAQKTDMAKAEKNIDHARGGLADFQQVTRDANAAKDLEKARQLGIVAKQYEAIAASAGDAGVKAKAAEQAAAFSDKQAQLIVQATGKVHTSVSKTAPLTKGLGEANELAVMDKVTANAQIIRNVERLRELKAQIGTGPIEGRLGALKVKFGMGNMDDAEFKSRLGTMLSESVKAVSGATASDQERSLIEDSIANWKLDDKQFDRLLSVMEERSRGSLKQMERWATSNGKRPIDSEGYINDLRKTQPSYSFKPTGK